MSPRTGRPKSKNPRNVSLNIRLTKDESNMIQNCADKYGLSRTDVILLGIKKLLSK